MMRQYKEYGVSICSCKVKFSIYRDLPRGWLCIISHLMQIRGLIEELREAY